MMLAQFEPSSTQRHRKGSRSRFRLRPFRHRRLAAYLGTLSASRAIAVPPWPLPAITGPLAFIAVGSLWGLIIGMALGGGVGAVYFLIGALYGAPYGAAVGLAIGVPASIILAAVLLVRDRRATDTHKIANHVAGGLAALLELLTLSAWVAITFVVVTGAQWSLPGGAILLLLAVLLAVISAGAALLLRFAARDLVRTWARAWGQQVIPSPRPSCPTWLVIHVRQVREVLLPTSWEQHDQDDR